MKKQLFLCITLMLGTALCAQDKKDVIEKGIRVVKTFEQNFADGDKTQWLEKEETYNYKGLIVEYKEYDAGGKAIKTWVQYAYDSNANLIEEKELDGKGEQIERFEYKYVNGLKTEKCTYDSKNRLAKKKVYTYEFRP